MALGTITPSQPGGRSPSQPLTFDQLLVVGDDSYTTGGTLLFEASVRTALGRTVELLGAEGFGLTAGAITHFAEYDAAADSLIVWVLAGTEAANTADLSGVTFKLRCMSR